MTSPQSPTTSSTNGLTVVPTSTSFTNTLQTPTQVRNYFETSFVLKLLFSRHIYLSKCFHIKGPMISNQNQTRLQTLYVTFKCASFDYQCSLIRLVSRPSQFCLPGLLKWAWPSPWLNLSHHHRRRVPQNKITFAPLMLLFQMFHVCLKQAAIRKIKRRESAEKSRQRRQAKLKVCFSNICCDGSLGALDTISPPDNNAQYLKTNTWIFLTHTTVSRK